MLQKLVGHALARSRIFPQIRFAACAPRRQHHSRSFADWSKWAGDALGFPEDLAWAYACLASVRRTLMLRRVFETFDLVVPARDSHRLQLSQKERTVKLPELSGHAAASLHLMLAVRGRAGIAVDVFKLALFLFVQTCERVSLRQQSLDSAEHEGPADKTADPRRLFDERPCPCRMAQPWPLSACRSRDDARIRDAPHRLCLTERG